MNAIAPISSRNKVMFRCLFFIFFSLRHVSEATPTTSAMDSRTSSSLRGLSQPANSGGGGVIFLDTFNQGPKPFDPSQQDSDYFYFAFDANNVADDGITTQTAQAVTVTANPYTQTLPPSPSGGDLDHVKNLALTKQVLSPTSAKPKLKMELTFTGETYGTEHHPFGATAVTNDQDDIRLASVGMINVDFETFMVADFLLSNEGIWAFYERLPFGKGGPLGDYHAFSSCKRVGDRSPTDVHRLAVEYDKGAGKLRWYVENKLVLLVDAIGKLATDPAVNVILDYGGVDTVVTPNGFQSGFGLFSLMDMMNPTALGGDSSGLIRLSNVPGYYVHPTQFVDALSLESNRLFGQGATITATNLKVTVSS